MPLNSELRCSGIALVAEALLHVDPSDEEGCDAAEDVGLAMWERALHGRPLSYRANLCLDGKLEELNQVKQITTQSEAAVIQRAIRRSIELGAPQPKPMPPGYGELPN
jgi:hypothetical protein